MLIYIILLLLPLFLALVNHLKPMERKTQNVFYWELCILFTIVAALRFNVGTDYNATYATVFDWLKIGLKYNYEFIFLNLNYFFINHGGKIYYLTAFCSLVTIPAFFQFIKKNVDRKYWFFSVFLFIGTTIFYATLNIVRQYLAISMFLMAFNLYKDKKYLKSFLFASCCYFIHSSSIFMIPIFILSILLKNKKMKKLLLLIYVFSLVCIVIDMRSLINMISFIIPDRYVGYLNSVFILEKNYSAIFKLILPNFIIYNCLKKYDYFIKEKELSFEIAALFVNVILSNMFYGVNIIIRLTFYCDYFILIVIPYLIEYFHNEKVEIIFPRSRKNMGDIFVYLLIIYFLFLNAYSIFYKNGHGVIPYKSIWG